MTVRAVEKLAAEQAAKAEKPAKKRKTTDQYYKEMELELTDRLQRKVSVTYGRKKRHADAGILQQRRPCITGKTAHRAGRTGILSKGE